MGQLGLGHMHIPHDRAHKIDLEEDFENMGMEGTGVALENGGSNEVMNS